MVNSKFLKKALQGERVGLIDLVKRWFIQRALKNADWQGIKPGSKRKEALATRVLPSLKRDAEIMGPYQIHFRGWLPEQTNTGLVGVWVAQPVKARSDLPLLYAAYPGAKGQYYRGEKFDIHRRRNQCEITPKTSEDGKNVASADAYLRLKSLVSEQISNQLERDHERSHI